MQVRALEDLSKTELIEIIKQEREQMEGVGAGGVSGRIISKTLEQHRADFEAFCSANGLNTRQDTITGSGLFNSHLVNWMWRTWKEAKGVDQ